eukprot:gnl/MRDRNA2_/MRDRNA2_114713_c0_seq1.p1 gnl/MRDRNA2_/MRDRNA2_114713_c0~~gnl/MRDRNA2_/MRDRNA2_114713_c0_seq1.p1  ORF type:complete len:247 (+),score=36.02 gnl/MRDRNA2_/MRDRNA2_114713_c0_seq1:93-833(+)
MCAVRICCPRPDRLQVLDSLKTWSKEDLCDLELVSSEGDSFKVHRLVIRIASQPLGAMLQNAIGFDHGGQPSIPLPFSTIVIKAAIGFLYEGDVTIEYASVPELLKFAQKYELHSLRNDILSILPEQMTESLCSSLLADYSAMQSKHFNLDLRNACKSYAIANFEACSSTDSFKLWPAALLLDLVESGLMVSQEENVLLAVLSWYAADPRARKDVLQVVFRGVRLSHHWLEHLWQHYGIVCLGGDP